MAAATFASVRSANQSTRLAGRSLLTQLRPLLLRNVGTALAVLNQSQLHAGRMIGVSDQPDLHGFRRLTRDLYISAGDRGFWQGTYDMLYGDAEGTQRILARFVVVPAKEDTWITSVSRHWNLDRPNPRWSRSGC